MKLNSFILILFTFVVSMTHAQQIVFTPQWTPQSQFAGYYVAQELGFYDEAGVDVLIEHISASDSAVNRIISGRSNAVTMLLFDAVYQIENGTPIVNILQTAQRSGHVIVVRDDSIKSLKDLKNRRVGIWRSNLNQLGQLVSKDYNLNIEWVPFVQSINLYISGAIDATMAMTYNEVYWIVSSGFENKKIIYLSDVGYDFPEEGVYISREYYEKYPEKARAFADASRRGWEWAHQNPDKALDIVMKVMKQEGVPASRIHQKWMLREVLRMQCLKGESKPSFELCPDKVDALNALLIKHNHINNAVSIDYIQGK